MPEPKTLTRGDSCPSCNGDFKEALVPTAKQRAKANDRENPEPLGPAYDTASEEFRAEHGALGRCQSCGYQARFPLEAKKGAKKSEE